MPGSKGVLLVVSLLLISPMGHAISLQDDGSKQSSVSLEEDSPDRSWTTLSNPISTSYEMSEVSGLIHSPYGTFAPIYEVLPNGPRNILGMTSPWEDNVYVIQSNSADLQGLEILLQSIGSEVVDHLPDHSLIVTIPEDAGDGYVEQISRLPQVRWVGPLPTAWKISPALLPFVVIKDISVDLDIIPFPNLLQEEVISLSEDIGHYSQGPQSHLCGPHLCQTRGSDTSIVIDLSLIHI